MPSSHSIRAVALAWMLAVPCAAQAQPAAPESGTTTLTIFMRGAPVGTEQATLMRTGDGWTIASTGRIGAPIDAVARRIEVKYTGDWRRRDSATDSTTRGAPQPTRTVVDGNQAKSVVTTSGQPVERAQTIDPNAVLVLPNTFFAPFEAVAARLRNAAPGS